MPSPTSTDSGGDAPPYRMYGVETIAEMFDVESETVRRWISKGELKAVKFSKFWRVHHDDLKAFAEARFEKGKHRVRHQ